MDSKMKELSAEELNLVTGGLDNPELSEEQKILFGINQKETDNQSDKN